MPQSTEHLDHFPRWMMHLWQHGPEYVRHFMKCLAPITISAFLASTDMLGAISQSFNTCVSFINAFTTAPAAVISASLITHAAMVSLERTHSWADKGKNFLLGLTRFGLFIGTMALARKVFRPEHVHEDTSMHLSDFACQTLCLISGVIGMLLPDVGLWLAHKIRKNYHTPTVREDAIPMLAVNGEEEGSIGEQHPAAGRLLGGLEDTSATRVNGQAQHHRS